MSAAAPLDQKQKEALNKAVKAVETLGEQKVLPEVKDGGLLGPFVEVLKQYDKDKVAFQRNLRAEAALIRSVAVKGGAVEALQPESKKVPDPDLTILAKIEALIKKPEDSKSLREQLKAKHEGSVFSLSSSAINPAWKDLLALVNLVWPEAKLSLEKEKEEEEAEVEGIAPFTFQNDEEQQAYKKAFESKFVFKDQEEWNLYQALVLERYKFENADEWELYKFAVSEAGGNEKFQDPAYWESHKKRQREMAAPPREPVQLIEDEDKDEEGASSGLFSMLRVTVEDEQLRQAQQLSLQQAQADEQARKRKEERDLAEATRISLEQSKATALSSESLTNSEKRTFWQWFALFLMSAAALVCTGVLVCSAIALATHAPFFIVPLSAALPLVIMTASLLLVLAIGIGYALSLSSKGSGGSGPLLTTPRRSDAVPAGPLPTSSSYQPIHGQEPDLSGAPPSEPGMAPTGSRDGTSR